MLYLTHNLDISNSLLNIFEKNLLSCNFFIKFGEGLDVLNRICDIILIYILTI